MNRIIITIVRTIISMVGGIVVMWSPLLAEPPRSTLNLTVTDQTESHQGEFRSIFNGRDLTGWDGNPDHWRVEDGILIGETNADAPLGGSSFIAYTQEKFTDFELRLSFHIEGERANSGVQYRSRWVKDRGKWELTGYQADFDADNVYTGLLYEAWGRGVMTQPGETVILHATDDPPEQFKYRREVVHHDDAGVVKIEQGRWYEYRILARGFHFVHQIGDQVTVDVVDKDTNHRQRHGWIGFQLHDGPPMKVAFKEIRIREMDE